MHGEAADLRVEVTPAGPDSLAHPVAQLVDPARHGYNRCQTRKPTQCRRNERCWRNQAGCRRGSHTATGPITIRPRAPA